MIKTYVNTIFALMFLLAIWSCGSGPILPIVHAQAPPEFAPAHQEAVCSSGCVAMQSTNFLELRLGPTFNTAQDGFHQEQGDLQRSFYVKSPNLLLPPALFS